MGTARIYKKIVVYKIVNSVTGDFYIGSSVDFGFRKWSHLNDLRLNKHHSPILQNSYNKHGEDKFKFEILETFSSPETLIAREQFYIDTLKPRYNISQVAGSTLGLKHSEQARLNMSKAHKCLTKEQRGHKVDCICCICKRPSGKESYRYIPRETRVCVCGCKTEFEVMIHSTKKYVVGHNNPKGRKNE